MKAASRILDYSARVHRIHSWPVGGSEPSAPLVRRQGWCPFCKREADTTILMEQRTTNEKGIIQADPDHAPLVEGCFFYDLSLWECPTCGWWDVSLRHVEGGDSGDENVNDVSLQGMLRQYDDADISLPVQALRRELLKREDAIYHIHDKKMEELVGSVFRDFFPQCEVTLCGKTGDGGIDLIAMLTDTPFVVQVKWRTRKNSVERVEPVRAFLGVSLLRGMDHLLYVTSASRFTGGPYGAQTTADRALELRLVKEFHLIDRQTFFEMLRLSTSRQSRPWVKLLPPVFADVGRLLDDGIHLGA